MSASPQQAEGEVRMFIASRREDWNIGLLILWTAETIEEMEGWVKDYALEGEDGSKIFVYWVDPVPAMQYTVIREVRGDSWDGTTKP